MSNTDSDKVDKGIGGAGSISRFRLNIMVQDKGSAECEVIRHLAPLTANAILKGLPLQNRVHRYSSSFIYIETGLIVGAEKQKTNFKRGDIGFMVSNGAVCFVVKDSTLPAINPIGKVVKNLELIEACKQGDVIVIEHKRN